MQLTRGSLRFQTGGREVSSPGQDSFKLKSKFGCVPVPVEMLKTTG